MFLAAGDFMCEPFGLYLAHRSNKPCQHNHATDERSDARRLPELRWKGPRRAHRRFCVDIMHEMKPSVSCAV